jgi:hypothetical protein
MKRFALAVCAVALVACAKRDDTATDTAGATAAAAAATPAAPAPIRASDISGTWAVKGRNAANDSALVDFDFATSSESTFTMTFANGQKVNGRIVSIAGDSIVIEAGPYPSVLRKGVQVRTTGTLRLQDGRLVGTTTARYNTKRADSVVMLRTEGTRKP